ncbi:MAG: hypothetical protein HFI08_02135 [Bacilli bacterium]|jgi:hypothetical protein|nr:hypothetical protein [Bacilli bacterium]
MKEEFLKLKNDDELEIFEQKILYQKRNELYHEILEDPEMKQHLLKLVEVDEKYLKSVLMIDGNIPLDDFDEEEI